MKFKRFEDIIAWQKSQDFIVAVYASFNGLKDYSFKDQICRATISISNNIAEGFDRISTAEFKRFLYISLGSCSEVKSMLYSAERLNYIDSKKREVLMEQVIEISKIITGLIKSITPKELTTDN